MQSRTVQVSEAEEAIYDSIRKLADLLLPDRVDFSDIKGHLSGYSKQKAIEQLLKRAKQDPLITRIKLHLVYCELNRLANNGGL